MIKKQIAKASAIHNAQMTHTTYRGVAYEVNGGGHDEPHGAYCYRGRIYTK